MKALQATPVPPAKWGAKAFVRGRRKEEEERKKERKKKKRGRPRARPLQSIRTVGGWHTPPSNHSDVAREKAYKSAVWRGRSFLTGDVRKGQYTVSRLCWISTNEIVSRINFSHLPHALGVKWPVREWNFGHVSDSFRCHSVFSTVRRGMFSAAMRTTPIVRRKCVFNFLRR